MHSTSTRALRAKPLAASALRAGKGFLKNSPIPWHPGAVKYYAEKGVKM